jgi:GT2 family glycosyltransferase
MARCVIELSVITIVHNRAQHLQRLIEGLTRSTTSPRELIVVDMSDDPVTIPDMPFPSQRIAFDAKCLALAEARNLGARAAGGERLLFLDVDCIPRTNLVAAMDRELLALDALICPEVRYLGPNDSDHQDDIKLERASVQHPVRTFPDHGSRREPNAGLFWSLTFGIRRVRFDALGGFDQGYEGYGAEDTDFGFRAAEAGLPLLFLGGTGSFHQHHGVISPPLQHVADIVRNANRFHTRWGTWPMDGWLKQFEELGLVSFSNGVLRLERAPSSAELKAATQPPSTYF